MRGISESGENQRGKKIIVDSAPREKENARLKT